MSQKQNKQPESLRWTVEIAVDRIWVEDGFNLTLEDMQKAMQVVLPYAYKKEVQIHIVKAPPEVLIKSIRK